MSSVTAEIEIGTPSSDSPKKDLLQIEHFSWIQDSVRVPGVLQSVHELDHSWAKLCNQLVALADAVLASAGATNRLEDFRDAIMIA